MARVIGGKPRYSSEEKVLRHLQTSLPDTYLLDICRKLPIGKSKEYREIDLLVIAPHAIYLLEVKNYHGTITGDRDRWAIKDGASISTFDNPLRQADYNAQSSKTFLVEAIPELRRLLWVQALVVLSSDRVQVAHLPEDVAQRVCTVATLVPTLQHAALIPSGRGSKTTDLLPYHSRIEMALIGRTSAPQSPGARVQPAAPTTPSRPATAQAPRAVRAHATQPTHPAAELRARPRSSPRLGSAGARVGLIALALIMIYAGFRLVGGFINNRSEAIDVPTPSLARPQPNAYPTAVLSRPTPIPAPTLEQPSLGGIRPGSTVIVVNTGVPLNGRQEPNLNSPVVAIFAEGAPLQILEGPITADGYIWWKVQGDAGIGWSAAGSLDGATWLQIVQN